MVGRAFGGAGAALLGLLLTIRVVDGSYTSLVQGWYEPLLVGSIAILAVLAILAAGPLLRSNAQWKVSVTPYQAGVAALVLVPVVIGIAIRPEPLGSRSLERASDSGNDSLRSDAVDLLSSTPGERNVLEWAYAFEYEDPRTLVGEPVELIAFVHHPENAPPGRFEAARFAVACCVADATGYTVPVQWAEADALADDQWVQIIGAIAIASDGRLVVQATGITPIDAPANPYIYP